MSERPTKAIVVAAGRGRRLQPYTDEMPKTLVPIEGKPILGWQIDAYRAHGIDDVVCVRGYLGDVLERRAGEVGGLRFVDNHEWEHNNILESLFCAAGELEGPVLVSYSDIIFTPEVVGALMDTAGDICLVIDREFARIYEGRTEHPLEEAEVADLDAAGRVARVGKRALPPAEAYGEFIGLMKLSATGARWLREAWTELERAYAGDREHPFQRAATFRNAYLTDLLQHLIEAGRPVTPVPIDGQWREIDTVQDLRRACELLRCSKENWR